MLYNLLNALDDAETKLAHAKVALQMKNFLPVEEISPAECATLITLANPKADYVKIELGITFSKGSDDPRIEWCIFTHAKSFTGPRLVDAYNAWADANNGIKPIAKAMETIGLTLAPRPELPAPEGAKVVDDPNIPF